MGEATHGDWCLMAPWQLLFHRQPGKLQQSRRLQSFPSHQLEGDFPSSSGINRKASVNKTKAKDRQQSSAWAGAAAGLGSLPPLSRAESCSLPSAERVGAQCPGLKIQGLVSPFPGLDPTSQNLPLVM